MNKHSTEPPARPGLRRRAEAQLRQPGKKTRSTAGYATAAEDTQRLLHELQVHQLELEMQNTELQDSSQRLESLLEKYTDLYDFSPVGYFTLSSAGTIQQVNLTGARLVRLERSRLSGRAFGLLVSQKHRAAFHVFLKQVFSVKTKQSCELSLVGEGHPERFINIDAQRSAKGTDCSAVVMDITDRKRIEEAQRGLEVLAESNRKLEKEIAQRQAKETALRKRDEHKRQLLEQALLMQAQFRHLSREVLRAQEEERKRISRELHDVIAQTLTGINLQLATLNAGEPATSKKISQRIIHTQGLVGKSIEIIHRFARELRPAALDDLGLIPALHSFMKHFTKETGIRVTLTAYAGVEKLSSSKRAVLYRVANEALNNVDRHAQTDRAEVILEKGPNTVCLIVRDQGIGFDPKYVLAVDRCKRLGILGTRERVEMVGGTFAVESTPGKGTTLRAEIPFWPGKINSEVEV
jgi:signal transduction histidine kinase